MNDLQIKTLLASEYVLQNVRLRPDQSLNKMDASHALNGFAISFDEALGLWAITGLSSTTHVAADDVISLHFSNFDKVDRAAA